MATNISKYIQLNDFLLLEYQFNRDGSLSTLTTPYMVVTDLSTKYFYEGDNALGGTNNILPLNAIPVNTQRTSWLLDSSAGSPSYAQYWDSSTVISTTSYPCDTLKVHIISGYNFDDIGGFLLQVRAMDASLLAKNDLANFIYAKQTQTLGSNVVKFAPNTLFLGNRFYDKYVEFSIPSIQSLGADALSANIETVLNIANLSDVYITYSTISDEIINNQFALNEITNVQLPVTSVADNFNCYIAESTEGDFIEYYATWNNFIIGNYINDIETGRIKLYTSNNPNDNYSEFTEAYGSAARKWVIIHEITVYEQLAGLTGTSLISQKYAFTQDADYTLPNFFRPILRNADIDASYTIQYTCRLLNRMDGTQIIRKASFASSDPKKYGLLFTRLNVENIIPYKIFNKLDNEKANIMVGNRLEKTKYIKVFYDTTNVTLNEFNEVFPQGTGPLFLKSFDSTYKFKFERIDTNSDKVNVDLSGAFNYALAFKLANNSKIEVGPTYTSNMNTAIGEIEFKLSEDQLTKLKSQTNNTYSIIIKNPNGTSYTFYEGIFYNIEDQSGIIENYKNNYTITDLQTSVAQLQAEVNRLTDENATLQTS